MDSLPQPVLPDDQAAREHIVSLCRQAGVWGCPRCRSGKTYRLGSGRLRCPGCGYTFHELTGRFMGAGGLRPAQWLRMAELFAGETPVKQSAALLDISYNTAYKAMDALRQAILSQATDARQIRRSLAERDAEETPPVFGVMEHGRWVFVDLLPDVEAADLTLYKSNFRLRTARVGSVVYTGPVRGYLGLVCCGGPQWVSTALRGRGGGLDLRDANPFWGFLMERLARLQGVSPEKFPYYLKELEFRWNHRGQDLADLVTRLALAFMPGPEE
ncbi:transposase [Fundidesulfovibrio soli]|uniref:transposase n=1 Tax=Fundidesulfovibrio soli TaxID=2922716 RepID=UPI001FAFC831|nr:transposase [Fundidesulfovibrio soli]